MRWQSQLNQYLTDLTLKVRNFANWTKLFKQFWLKINKKWTISDWELALDSETTNKFNKRIKYFISKLRIKKIESK